jgi:hypothetical protein
MMEIGVAYRIKIRSGSVLYAEVFWSVEARGVRFHSATGNKLGSNRDKAVFGKRDSLVSRLI